MPLPLPRRARLAACLAPAAALALAACDLPTSAPKWETSWGVRLSADTLAIADFLPPDVSVSGGAFRVTPPAALASVTAAALCGGACPGGTVPKPRFEATVQAASALPGDVLGGTLGQGNVIRVRLSQSVGGDLLAPAGATESGSLTFTIYTRDAAGSWTPVVADVVSGAAATLPTDQTLERQVALPAGAVLRGEVEARAALVSPAGSPIALNGAGAITLSVDVPQALRFADASVRFAPRTIAGEGVALDLSALDLEDDRVGGATIDLAITNPLAVVGEGALAFQRAGQAVIQDRAFTLASGTSTSRVTLTADELRALRAGDVTVRPQLAARAVDAAGLVTVRATDAVVVRATVTAVVRPAGAP